MTNPHKEIFQKYICCRPIEDQSKKVEPFEVTHAVRSYLIWWYFQILGHFWQSYVMSVYSQKIEKKKKKKTIKNLLFGDIPDM